MFVVAIQYRKATEDGSHSSMLVSLCGALYWMPG